jgi:hypothetical protein
VIEAGQINEVATSAASALEMLDRLLSISDPAYLTRRHGFVQIGFLASGHHIGTLHVREGDFKELLNALRCHFPNRHRDTAHDLVRPKNGDAYKHIGHPSKDATPQKRIDASAEDMEGDTP